MDKKKWLRSMRTAAQTMGVLAASTVLGALLMAAFAVAAFSVVMFAKMLSILFGPFLGFLAALSVLIFLVLAVTDYLFD